MERVQQTVPAYRLFREGRLPEALEAAQDALRRSPGDVDLRLLYFELLVFAGDLERASTAIEAALRSPGLTPRATTGLVHRKRLLRGEAWRQQWYRQGRVPMLLTEISPAIEALMRVNVLISADELDEAAAASDRVDELRARPRGEIDDVAIGDWRDLDDRCGGVLECITAGGDYAWLDMANVSALRFEPPSIMMDLLWRETQVRTVDQSTLDVHVPVLYAGSAQSLANDARLGRATVWTELTDTLAVGVGQRCIWTGAGERAILEIDSVKFESEGRDAGGGGAS